jgi:pilus assembly protein CpaE
MSAIRITLVGEADTEDRLRLALPELNGELQRWEGSPGDLYVRRDFESLIALGSDVVAFGPELPVESALELAAELDRRQPNAELLLLAEPTPGLWERAARAGVREVVSLTADLDALRMAVRRTLATAEGRRAREPEASGAVAEDGLVIVVRSPKGGSGKTMVASNLAVSLAKRFPNEVVVVDLDLQFGDLSTALAIEPTYTIADATANVDLTPTGLKALLSTHASSVCVLCAPPRPGEASVITGEDVTAVLQLLQSAFRYVVVDTAAGTDQRVEAAIASATDVVLVCSMDVSSVRAIRKDIESTPSAVQQRIRQHVVLNRADSRVALEIGDIEATIGRRIDVHVSSSRLVPLHMNCGVPVVEAEPSSPVAKQLRELVGRLVPTPTVTPRRALRRRR